MVIVNGDLVRIKKKEEDAFSGDWCHLQKVAENNT
jgi:hypothetical protein